MTEMVNGWQRGMFPNTRDYTVLVGHTTRDHWFFLTLYISLSFRNIEIITV